MIDQRKGFLSDRPQNAELDKIYKNQNAPTRATRISKNYTAKITDSRVYFLQGGLTLTLPSLPSNSDGQKLFLHDRTAANFATQTILPNTGHMINGSASATITANFGFLTLEWDGAKNQWFKVG